MNKKMEAMFVKALLTDKCLLYEDEHVQIGCIKSVSLEWRQATVKLFLGNKSPTNPLTNIYFTRDASVPATFIQVRYEDQLPFHIEPNDQLEV